MSSYVVREELELELAGGDDSSSASSTKAEQEQGLLRDWRRREQAVPDFEGSYETTLRGWSRRRWLAIAAAACLSLLVSIGFVFSMMQTRTSAVPDAMTIIRTNEYTLGPLWDVAAPPQRREYTWTIHEHMHNPDGVYRQMILVNNQFPGPLIEVNEGDTIVVHVDNQATNATSIHWHGLFQNGTPHMDGTVGITQCPIPPSARSTYEFKVSGQSGTYWWHAHQGLQSSDGVHGPLIIHSRNERVNRMIECASDRVILLSDHYHDLSSALLWQYLAPDMENAEPVPQSGLINGRSVRDCSDFPQRHCDNSSAHLSPATFKLKRGENHRIRFINVGAFAEFLVQIDGHELAVTEVDGTDVVPVSFHRINIQPAQRYSVVITADQDEADAFWLRARMVTTCFTDPPATMEPDAWAIVRYSTSDNDDSPTSRDWIERLDQECSDLNTTELAPVEAVAAPASPNAFFYLRSNFEIGAYRLSRGVFNSSSWRADPRSSSLLRAIDGMSGNNLSYSMEGVSQSSGAGASFVNSAAFDLSRELVVQTTGIQTIDIMVSNFDDGTHPLHLHGYKFWILAQGHGYPPLIDPMQGITQANLQPLYESLDLTNPLRRDTASVQGFGWILLRFVADNPGAWAFHCHVSWHAEAGLLMQFLTRSDELKDFQVPEASRALCAADGVEKGMGPKDEDYRDLAK